MYFVISGYLMTVIYKIRMLLIFTKKELRLLHIFLIFIAILLAVVVVTQST